MGTVRLDSLDDYERHKADVEVTCTKCGRLAVFDSREIVRFFRTAGWNRALDAAVSRFRCEPLGDGCGSKAVRIRAKARSTARKERGYPPNPY